MTITIVLVSTISPSTINAYMKLPVGNLDASTSMDVDPKTGYIYIVFYDRRHFPDNRTDVYLAYSTDGGTSFVNTKINESTFTPSSMVFLGDYNDISAYDNQIRPIWTQMDKAGTSIWTALLSMQ